MNTIFKAKRKIFYLISAAFYILFFAAGYFIGSGFNIDKLKEVIENIFF